MDGSIAPRLFVCEFFELTEAGNMRSDIRKKLVLSLLLSENIRPSIKFLFLENFDELPSPVRRAIVSEVMKAEPSHHMEILKEELRWMTSKAVKTPKFLELKDAQQKKDSMVQPFLNQKVKGKPRPWIPGEGSVAPIKTEVLWH